MARSTWIQDAAHALEAAGGGGIIAFLTYRLKRREVKDATAKSMVDMASGLTETALALLVPVQEAAAKAEEQVKALKKQIAEFERTVDSLTSMLAEITAKADADQAELKRQLAEVTAERDALRTAQTGAGVPAP